MENDSSSNHSAERRQEILEIEARLIGRLNANQNHSVQFALVLVANLMLINSGALLVFPSLIQRTADKSFDLNFVSSAAWSFVVGIVLAAACGYSAYHNFMAHSQLETAQFRKEVAQLQYDEESLASGNLSDWSREIAALINKSEKVIGVTLWTGNITGLASLAFFVLGCTFVQAAILR